MKGAIVSNSEVILYTSHDGGICLKLKMLENTVWLTQLEIAELFGKSRSTIAEHISAIFEDGELESSSVCRNFRQTAGDGKLYEVIHYNLDLVLAVGYRTRSPRGLQFRKWATTVLREYLVKGFAMDDERLKNPSSTLDYFDEWLARIREIRASEKRFYQKVRDIYATAVDYDPKSDQAQFFFKKVQNKMLWAATFHTAPELIVERSDSQKPNMGLKSWKGSRVRQEDVTVAKNYLEQTEIEELNQIVVMYPHLPTIPSAEESSLIENGNTLCSLISVRAQLLSPLGVNSQHQENVVENYNRKKLEDCQIMHPYQKTAKDWADKHTISQEAGDGDVALFDQLKSSFLNKNHKGVTGLISSVEKCIIRPSITRKIVKFVGPLFCAIAVCFFSLAFGIFGSAISIISSLFYLLYRNKQIVEEGARDQFAVCGVSLLRILTLPQRAC